MWKVILWDIDNTLLDFFAAEKKSLKAVFQNFGLGKLSDEKVAEYSAVNIRHWERLERGEITKAEVMHGRFTEFLSRLNITDVDPDLMNAAYEAELVNHVEFVENGYDVIQSLKDKYKHYAVTNGAYEVQTKKLAVSGLDRIFDKVFISDEIGYEKPRIQFFQPVLENIIPCERDEILIVGDSLTSDMRGGNNIGIKCCWYNPRRKVNTTDVKTDYEIHSLKEIYEILGGK